MWKIPESGITWLVQVLEERFGHFFKLSVDKDRRRWRIQLPADNGSIYIDKNFFQDNTSGFGQPCAEWNAEEEGWSPILGKSLPAPMYENLWSPLIERYQEDYIIHFDIISFTYWNLTRVEEINRTDVDFHDRFPAVSSYAYQHGYLDRPVVDEWLYILGLVIMRRWPTLKLTSHQFRILLSHDVDHPTRYGFANLRNLTRRMAGDFARGQFARLPIAPLVRLNSQTKLHRSDPYNVFDWIMDVSDSNGIVSAFYFICGKTSNMDGEYDIAHPALRSLLRRIHERNHEIGLHPSYNTYKEPEVLANEAKRLRKICGELNIRQDCWGGRMHYLRYQIPTTLSAWAKAGMDYESSLGFADRTGFRAGTCFEYPGYDPVKGEILPIRVRPLVAMEVSNLRSRLMKLDSDELIKTLIGLKEKCRKLGGQFSLLWHNSQLDTPAKRSAYEEVVSVEKI